MESRCIRKKIWLNATVPNLAPARTRYAALLLSIPESPERFHLQTPNTDTIYDDVQTKSSALFTLRHEFFSLDAGALKKLGLGYRD